MTHILLIADATESAASCWPQTTRAIADLLAALPAGSVAGIALLGTNLMWPVEAWRPDLPLPAEAAATGSFVAPVMAGVRARGLALRWAVIAGSGEVFDLADWAAAGIGWALLRTGDASLQAPGGRTAEFALAGGVAPLVSLLAAAPPSPPPAAERDLTGSIKQRWELDPTGYPMVYVPPLGAFVHLFPVAKPQFEAFLAAAPSPARRDRWYGELLALNPRLSPWSQHAWQATSSFSSPACCRRTRRRSPATWGRASASPTWRAGAPPTAGWRSRSFRSRPRGWNTRWRRPPAASGRAAGRSPAAHAAGPLADAGRRRWSGPPRRTGISWRWASRATRSTRTTAIRSGIGRGSRRRRSAGANGFGMRSDEESHDAHHHRRTTFLQQRARGAIAHRPPRLPDHRAHAYPPCGGGGRHRGSRPICHCAWGSDQAPVLPAAGRALRGLADRAAGRAGRVRPQRALPGAHAGLRRRDLRRAGALPAGCAGAVPLCHEPRRRLPPGGAGQGPGAAGHASRSSLHGSSRRWPTPARWPAEGLALLGRLAWRAAELLGRREPVLAGRHGRRAVWRCSACSSCWPRRHSAALLSFDTRVEGCNFGPQVTFWAHGYVEPPQRDVKHLLDARPGGRVRVRPAGGRGWALRDVDAPGRAALRPGRCAAHAAVGGRAGRCADDWRAPGGRAATRGQPSRTRSSSASPA